MYPINTFREKGINITDETLLSSASNEILLQLRNRNQTPPINNVPKEEFLKLSFAFEKCNSTDRVALTEDLTAESSFLLPTSFSHQPTG